MDDIQKMFDMLAEAAHDSRSNYHLTLEKAIEWCDQHPQNSNAVVRFAQGGSPSHPHSYRGYYSDLAFEMGPDVTLKRFRDMLADCLGREFEGYKGGNFQMTTKTPLWCSSYGDASGLAIMDMQAHGELVTVITKKVD